MVESIFVVLIVIAGSLAFLFLLDLVWPAEARRPHNDIVGWQIAVLGTIYGVVIGFMLFAVWTHFEMARLTAGAEANALVNLSRISDGLPPADQSEIQQLAIQYADTMVTQEWPLMEQGKLADASGAFTRQMWLVLARTNCVGEKQWFTLNRAMAEMAVLTQKRRDRMIQCHEKLPGILWGILIVGAIVTIGSSCVYGTANRALHAVQIAGLSLLIGLSLMAVAQIDRPYQGSVHVKPEGFIYAQGALRADRAKGL